MKKESVNSELLAKVRQIHIKTRKLVDNLIGGEYVSAFKGQGMEFNEVREYQPGDDIRTIDWNVTARTGIPHIKRYVEERELTVMLLVDISGSVQFGTTSKFKREAMAEVAATFALTAMLNNDKVGLMLFDDDSRKYIPPVKGKSQVLRVIREILTMSSTGHHTDIATTLDTFNQTQKKSAVVFLISDFMDDNFAESLRRTGRRHDLICVRMNDRIEKQTLPLGLVEVEDVETGECMVVDFNNKKMREYFESQYKKRTAVLNEEFVKAKCEQIHLLANQDLFEPLHRFFRQREKRLSHHRS